MKHELNLTPSQMEKLTTAYTESLEKSYSESHCQHYSKSKKAPCGRELNNGKCQVHKEDIYPPAPKPVTMKCDFPTASGSCGRSIKDIKDKYCGFHKGKTPIHEKKNCCEFVFLAGPRAGKKCDKLFSDYKAPGEDNDYVPEDFMKMYCQTHCMAMVLKNIRKQSNEDKKSDGGAKKKKSESGSKKKSEGGSKKKSEDNHIDEKQEVVEEAVEEVVEEVVEDEDLFGEADEIYPNLGFKFPDEEYVIASVPITVDGDKTTYVRAKLKLKSGSAVLTPFVYLKENALKNKEYAFVGYTTDLVNNSVASIEKKYHPVMDEFKVKFPHAKVVMTF
jgi:hypothetical protein